MGVLMGTQIGFGRNAERGGASLGFSGLKVLAAWAAGLGFVKLVSACTQTARLGRLWAYQKAAGQRCSALHRCRAC